MSQSPEYDRHGELSQAKPLPRLQESAPDVSCCYLSLNSGSTGRTMLELCCWCGACGVTSLWLPEGSSVHCWVVPRCSRRAGLQVLGSVHGCDSHGAAICDSVVAPLVAEADVPQCQAWAGGADFERSCKQFLSLPPPIT